MQAWILWLGRIFWKFNLSHRLSICHSFCELCRIPNQLFVSHMLSNTSVNTLFKALNGLEKWWLSILHFLIMIVVSASQLDRLFFLSSGYEYWKTLARWPKLCILFCCSLFFLKIFSHGHTGNIQTYKWVHTLSQGHSLSTEKGYFE